MSLLTCPCRFATPFDSLGDFRVLRYASRGQYMHFGEQLLRSSDVLFAKLVVDVGRGYFCRADD